MKAKGKQDLIEKLQAVFSTELKKILNSEKTKSEYDALLKELEDYKGFVYAVLVALYDLEYHSRLKAKEAKDGQLHDIQIVEERKLDFISDFKNKVNSNSMKTVRNMIDSAGLGYLLARMDGDK